MLTDRPAMILLDLASAILIGGLMLGFCDRALKITAEAHLADTVMERATAVVAATATFLAIPYAIMRVWAVLSRLW